MEALLAALACGCLFGAAWCARAVLPLRARVEQLELERPRFLAEMEGLLAACDESLERADSKRKRAENLARSKQREEEPEQPPLAVVRTGTFIDRREM